MTIGIVNKMCQERAGCFWVNMVSANIRAVKAKIKLPKSELKLSSKPRDWKLNLALSIFSLKQTFHVSSKQLNTRFKHFYEVRP